MTEAKETPPVPKQIRTYQPTFRLQPKIKFSSEIVEKLLQRLVPVDLEEVEYSDKGIPELCLSLSESIKDAVKELNFDRYRIIVSVTMGQKRQQSVQMFHSFLWDVDKDSFASFNYENCHIFVNVIVYGVYLD